jgi:hypothetical protein
MNTIEQALEQVLPKTLDEIIRTNRDRAQLYFSTSDELDPLHSPGAFGPVTGQISNWAFITFHIVETQVSFWWDLTRQQTLPG